MRKMGDDGALLVTSLVMMFSLDDASVSEQALILFFFMSNYYQDRLKAMRIPWEISKLTWS